MLLPSHVEGWTRWVRTRERERAWARRHVVILESSSLGGGGNEVTGDTVTAMALTRRSYLCGKGTWRDEVRVRHCRRQWC